MFIVKLETVLELPHSYLEASEQRMMTQRYNIGLLLWFCLK